MRALRRFGALFGRAVLPACVLVLASIAAAPARGAVLHGYPLKSSCPEAGIANIVDRWGMDSCNCTSYVAWALWANHQRIDWFISGAMDARNWPRVARLSTLPVGRAPRVGSVAVWPRLTPPFGHVAYVTGLERDGTFDVAEYNLPSASGSAPFAFDTRRHVRRTGAVFIYVPRRR